jgi:hypothetical protein
MSSTATTISISLTALLISGLVVWRRDSHASPHDTAPAPVTAVRTPIAAPAVAPVVAPATPVQPRTLAVRRLAVGTGVAAREVTGHAAEYELSPTSRFCAVMELANPSTASTVRVRFEPEGEVERSVGFVRLAVPSSPRYRTWACTERLRTTGTWSAVVETVGGLEIAREVFTVR